MYELVKIIVRNIFVFINIIAYNINSFGGVCNHITSNIFETSNL